MTMILIYLLSIVVFVRCQSQLQTVCIRLQDFHDSICHRGVGSGVSAPIQGPPGKRGAPGPKGKSGDPGSPGLLGRTAEVDYRRIDNMIGHQLADEYLKLGTITNPAGSCNEIRKNNMAAEDGLYYVQDLEGNVFQTFCSMNIAGGGWTLVASVHENNMKGRCTTGDRWSSEQGNSASKPHGDGFWENRATHGEATSATSDDYKNSGYFAMNASDVMIWQVPNDTPMERYASRAFLKYHTTSGFLASHGGNLGYLFSVDYNMRKGQYRKNVDNGPAIPIIWDTGSNEELLRMFGTRVKGEVEAGYVQFRAINHQGDAFALCSGVRIKPGMANVEHPCLGSTSTSAIGYCGDFAARDYAADPVWRLDQRLIDSVVMIFYK